MLLLNSRQVGGGSIKLVQVIKECTHAEALQYLQTVEAGAVETLKEPTPTNFHYYMKEHTQQNATIDYLLQERKLSRETIDFFLNKTSWHNPRIQIKRPDKVNQ